mmetsp:Transcript_4235/g.8867  ORF Transcript_4235/g.8867 Transcript_4235/m.8867 type:complete len:470 (+) Transcript_4235:423-1832(+)
MAALISERLPNFTDWPYVEVDGFHRINSALAKTGSHVNMAFAPLVAVEEQSSWEEFAYGHLRRQGFQPNAALEREFGGYRMESLSMTMIISHNHEGYCFRSLNAAPKTPRIHSSWFNLYSEPLLRISAMDKMFNCIEELAQQSTPFPDPIACGTRTDHVKIVRYETRGPASVMMHPIFPAGSPQDIVGIVPSSPIVWDEWLQSTGTASAEYNAENLQVRATLKATFDGLQQQRQHDRLIPLINVLPDLLREVKLSRRSRLNCWERESARTTGSKRNLKFRATVISFYERTSKSKKSVKCQILDEFTPTSEAQDIIIAAHIWKASARGQALEEFGLSSEDINNARNGLFLTKGIEDAFDKQQVCFLYNVLESRLVLWVADSSLMSEKILGSTKKFSDVHQKPLLCPPDRMPYRRLLSWHARLTLELRKHALVTQSYTSEYDNSPGRGHAVVDPLSRAIDEMVEPGDDASM